jgi:hypothetical protein
MVNFLGVILFLSIKVYASNPSAEKLLASEPPKYIVQANGKRLNSFISRDILILAEAFNATHDKKYLSGIVKYMNAAAQYPDWRAEQHYLSASYIVKAFGVALDLCGDEMSENERIRFENVLMEKGLRPSDGQKFWNGGDSYAQACASAVSYGAFAIRKRFPKESAIYLSRCIEATKKALLAYEPDGCYAEGPAYCRFATEKTDEMIAVLKKHKGDDANISKNPGYLKADEWVSSMIGLTGRVFNYADGGDISYTGGCRKVSKPILKVFKGIQPTGIVKGCDFFLAVKGGKANYSMAHMDAGSFIFETLSDGKAIRWVEDLGPEKIRRIEHADIDVDNYSQSSSRWSVFRYGPFSHSTFTLNGKLHNVDGFVSISHKDKDGQHLIADCSMLYEGFYKSAKRHFFVDENVRLKIVDEFIGVMDSQSYTFNFCTKADVKILGDIVQLEKDNRILRVESTVKGSWQVVDASKIVQRFESPNKGVKRVVFTATLPNGNTAVGFVFK